MKIFCDLCDYTKDIEDEYPPRICPKCGSLDFWFEDDKDWNILSSLWAMGHGWQGQPDSSLPEWYYRENKLEAWQTFKEILKDPMSIPPPNFLIKRKKRGYKRAKLTAYWLRETGLISTWKTATENLFRSLGMEVGDRSDEEVVSFLSAGMEARNQADEKDASQVWSLHGAIGRLAKAYIRFWDERTAPHRRN